MAVRKKKRHIFLRIALLAFSVYVVVVLVQLQLEIDSKKAVAEELEAQIAQQKIINEDLEKQLEDIDDYLEQEAREQGYSYPDEMVMVQIPGAK